MNLFDMKVDHAIRIDILNDHFVSKLTIMIIDDIGFVFSKGCFQVTF